MLETAYNSKAVSNAVSNVDPEPHSILSLEEEWTKAKVIETISSSGRIYHGASERLVVNYYQYLHLCILLLHLKMRGVVGRPQ